MRRLAHAYHIWADGFWNLPATEHFTQIHDAGLEFGYVLAGLAGNYANRAGARKWLETESGLPAGSVRYAEAAEGFEQVTLSALRRWAQGNQDAAVLYAHAKGAANISAVTGDHRRIMTEHVVGGWRDAVAALETCDMAGCFWVTPGARAWPPYPYFVGNFWWANASWLAGLPEPPVANRYDAEIWPGTQNPRVHEMSPSVSYPQLAESILGEVTM